MEEWLNKATGVPELPGGLIVCFFATTWLCLSYSGSLGSRLKSPKRPRLIGQMGSYLIFSLKQGQMVPPRTLRMLLPKGRRDIGQAKSRYAHLFIVNVVSCLASPYRYARAGKHIGDETVQAFSSLTG